MSTTIATLDKQINNYLTQLNTRQKKAVLSVVKTFVEEQEQESTPWDDATFVAEIDKRFAELESGKVKGHTWDEVRAKARRSLSGKRK